MNIIPSAYTSKEFEKFRKKEIEKVGEKNIKFIHIFEKVVDTIGLLSFLPILAIMFLIQNMIANFLIGIILIGLWALLVFKILEFEKYNLYKITSKLIKKKNITMSPILSEKYFNTLYEEHKTLCKIYDFAQKHPNAAFKYDYPQNGWVYLVYNDGNYIKQEGFQLHNFYAQYLFKEDKIDCSYCDKEIKILLDDCQGDMYKLGI